MLFRIRHRTSYRFSRPVFHEPHILRLRPRCDSFQSLLEYQLHVSPAPAGRSDGYDAEGNNATVLWFEGMTTTLEFLSEATVQTLRPNPFDYLLTHPDAGNLPACYPSLDEQVLEPYRRPGGGKGVTELARELSARTGGDAQAFLLELNSHLYNNVEVIIREEGDPFEPGEVLESSEGSCRDLTVLFMAVCREVGIACRFVSGYQEGDSSQTQRYMHAWPEVYLPGAGWRGYDPTLGLAVTDRHVALASGADARSAAPTVGSLRGTGAVSAMEVQLNIETEP